VTLSDRLTILARFIYSLLCIDSELKYGYGAINTVTVWHRTTYSIWQHEVRWYGMVNVDLYSAIITKVSNALMYVFQSVRC